jgi:quinol monooxygenase YgiN
LSATGACTVIAHVRPKPDAEEKLLAIREQMIQEFREGFAGFVSATLARVDGSDEWRDIVVFTDRASADAAHVETPAYKQWAAHVDLVSYEILDHITEHDAAI